MTYKKNLIEVALPLDAINKASAREKWSQQKYILKSCGGLKKTDANVWVGKQRGD